MAIGYIERIVGAERIGINDAVRLDLLLKDRPQRLGSGVGDDGGVTFPAPLSKPEDDHVACHAAASFALAHTPEVTLIRLPFATELRARELADEQRAQAHEEADRGVGLNADDLSGRRRRAARHNMLDQLALLTGTEAAFALIHRSHHRVL
jgi:hypothetical protein